MHWKRLGHGFLEGEKGRTSKEISWSQEISLGKDQN